MEVWQAPVWCITGGLINSNFAQLGRSAVQKVLPTATAAALNKLSPTYGTSTALHCMDGFVVSRLALFFQCRITVAPGRLVRPLIPVAGYRVQPEFAWVSTRVDIDGLH